MGNIVAMPNGRFQAQIRVAGEKGLFATFGTTEEAQIYIDTMEPRLRSKRLAKSGAQLKSRKVETGGLATLLNEKLHDVLKRHFDSDAVTIRQSKSVPTILRHVGDARVGEIDKTWVKAYIERIRGQKTRVGRQFTYATIAVHFQHMRTICAKRADDLKIDCPSLPFSTKLLPKGWDNKRTRRLHPKEAAALRERMLKLGDEAWGRQWRILIDLAIETGARQQELIWAEWNHVDIEAQVWIIPKEHTKCQEERQVPLSPYAKALALQLREMADPVSTRVFHALSKPENVSAYFRKMRVEAGITDFRFHDLRHEACARMVRERVLPETAIMEIVGHSDMAMLARYANLTIWEKVEMLNAAKEGRPPRPQPTYRMNGDTLETEVLPSISGVLLGPAQPTPKNVKKQVALVMRPRSS